SMPALGSLEYAGACIPAHAVGGDYYDFLSLGPDRLGLVIGDVMGKGMAAALLMANLQANLRSQVAFALDEPRRLLESVNLLFCENSPEGAFASLFYADYHDPTGELRYVNCGHLCALLLRRDGTLDRLEPTSTVLGLFRQWECSVRESRLEPRGVRRAASRRRPPPAPRPRARDPPGVARGRGPFVQSPRAARRPHAHRGPPPKRSADGRSVAGR
ncbi:MAG: hypothetical protein DMF81_24860, partial [Acidobacteria bacterium]